MANQSKFEAMLEKLIAEDKAGAEELFHEIVVEKSRDIYENLLADDTAEVEVDETANVATVEMSSTNLETGVVQVEQIAEVTLVASLDSFDSGSTTVDMPSVESIEADVGAQVDVAVADAIAEIELPELDMPETTVAEVYNQ